MNRIIRNTGFYILVFLVVVGIVQFIGNQGDEVNVITYDQFRQEIVNNNVQSVTVQFDGYTYLIRGQFLSASDPSKVSFETRAPIGDRVFEVLEASQVIVTLDK